MTDQHATAAPPNPAEMYDAHMVPAMFGPWADVIVDRIAPLAGEHFLDVACGTGAVTFKLAERVGPDGTVTGSDINPGMIAVGRRKSEAAGVPIAWHVADAVSLPQRPGGYDAVTCQQGVQFFPDSVAGLTSMHDALRPGGRLGLAIWYPVEHQTLFNAFKDAGERHFGNLPGASAPFSYGGEDRLREELDQAGFVNVAIDKVIRDVCFPDGQRFMAMSVRSIAAVVPALGQLPADELNALFRTLEEELAPEAARYRDGDAIRFSLTSHIAVAHRQRG
jgi:ubiquinone/menaquinone biosynthesis C-methylase UbiE